MTNVTPSGRPAAFALGIGAICWIFIGIVHPTVHHGNVIAQVARLSMHTAAVHAMAIAAVVALLFGVTVFSLRRGIGRSLVLAALVVYAIAAVAVIAAGTVDGFIVAPIASLAGRLDPSQLATTSQLLSACGIAIQAFTSVGLIGYTVAIVMWSADLAREPGITHRVGLLGFGTMAGTVALLFLRPHIGPHEIIGVGLLQALWYAAIAWLLADERV